MAFPENVALWMRPRDPLCVVVFWQLDSQALMAFAAANPGGVWKLRLTGDHPTERLLIDEELPLSADFRFIPVPHPGSRYVAEIGFRAADGSWRELSRSSPVTTPVAGPTATWTPQPTREEPARVETNNVSQEMAPSEDWRSPLPSPPPRRRRKSTVQGIPPTPASVEASEFPPAKIPADPHTAALLSLVWEPAAPSPLPSSADVTQWVARVVGGRPTGFDQMVPIGAPLSLPQAPSSAEHPAGPPAKPGFWFEVNAEIILYGRTEPDARVSIGGRPVTLRPDGSFSFRFSLPDGEYELPVIAVNARDDDGRFARLEFARTTEFGGEVGIHPQDPALKPPVVDSVE